jgi:hypothetical protein
MKLDGHFYFHVIFSFPVCKKRIANTILERAYPEASPKNEKWFASGESNVFRLSRDDVNGLSCIMITPGRPFSGKDF